jgi:hypothetical protein
VVDGWLHDMSASTLATIDFCGEIYPVPADGSLVIGREGDIVIDDNPYLHRRFLEVASRDTMWWLTNVGSQLTATVADEHATMQAWLAPGARLPLVFDRTVVWFTAGSTAYEFDVFLPVAPFRPITPEVEGKGDTTMGRPTFTVDQKLLMVALCEQVLRRGARGAGTVPSSADAANRLGWTLTKFNRKLDNVCQKLTRDGIRGLHGGPEKLATNRRARLVEYALAARLVDKNDLGLLEAFERVPAT